MKYLLKFQIDMHFKISSSSIVCFVYLTFSLSDYCCHSLFSFFFFWPEDLGSSFWGMVLILASTNVLSAMIAAGCFIAALLIVLCLAKNV